MKIVFHIGAHCTDQDRLVRSLLKNRESFSRQGIIIPGPGRYRKVLREVVTKLRGEPANKDAQDVILEAATDDDEINLLFFSNESFISLPSRAIEDGAFYPRAFKTSWLRNTFPENEVTFAIGLRNPATFIPALFAQQGGSQISFHEFITGTDPQTLSWSDVITRIRESNPDSEVIAWSNEDSALIWPDIMRAVTNLPPQEPVVGQLDLIAGLMTSDGLARLRTYLEEKPPADEIARRRIVSAFLNKYAIDSEIFEEIDLPGWSQALIDDLTRRYEEDLQQISRMEGVRLLTA